MENKKISVITPLYNSEKYLPPLIANFDRQTYRNFELIFIYDTSVDNTKELMFSLAETRPYIKCLLFERNTGPGPARNAGIKAATGNYLVYIDADDSFSDNYLECLKYAIEKDNVDMLFCGNIVQFPRVAIEQFILGDEQRYFYKSFTGLEVLGSFFGAYRNDVHLIGSPWGRIISKNFYDENNILFPDSYSEDMIMTFSELARAKKVACYNSNMYYYTKLNVSSATTILNLDKVYQDYCLPEHILEFLRASDRFDELNSYALRFSFGWYKYTFLNYFNVPYVDQNFGSLSRKFFDPVLNLDIKGNSYFIVCHLIHIYLISEIYGKLFYFKRVVSIFKDYIKYWIANSSQYKLNDFHVKFLRLFLELSDSDFEFKGKSSRAIFKFKAARKLMALANRAKIDALSRFYERYLISRSGWFDKEYFKRNNPDLANIKTSHLDYFIEKGWREKRNPNDWFDIKSYLESNKDIYKAGVNPLVHFYLYGVFERRHIAEPK